MKEQNIIFEIIYNSFDEMNKNLPKNKYLLKKTDEVIYGKEGKLDSLGLVSFIINIESKIEECMGKTIVLANEKAMSQNNSPFKTVQTFADYISSLIESDSNG